MTKIGHAPPLFLPGLLCDARIWTAQVTALGRVGARVIDGYGSARAIGEMARLALRSAPATFSLVGHSMGARVALEIYRLAPERVERLALLSTGVHPVKPGEAEKRQDLLALGRREGIEALVDAWLPPMVGRRRRADPAFVAPLRTMCIDAGLDIFEAQIEALLSRPEVGALLPSIACPVLIGVGADDEWSPVAQHEAFAARIPGAVLIVFDDCGHMSPVEASEAVTAALQDWLNRPSDRARSHGTQTLERSRGRV